MVPLVAGMRLTQGSILGPLLFSIFLNDFFCLSRNVNYVTIPITTLSINQEKFAQN